MIQICAWISERDTSVKIFPDPSQEIFPDLRADICVKLFDGSRWWNLGLCIRWSCLLKNDCRGSWGICFDNVWRTLHTDCRSKSELKGRQRWSYTIGAKALIRIHSSIWAGGVEVFLEKRKISLTLFLICMILIDGQALSSPDLYKTLRQNNNNNEPCSP